MSVFVKLLLILYIKSKYVISQSICMSGSTPGGINSFVLGDYMPVGPYNGKPAYVRTGPTYPTSACATNTDAALFSWRSNIYIAPVLQPSSGPIQGIRLRCELGSWPDPKDCNQWRLPATAPIPTQPPFTTIDVATSECPKTLCDQIQFNFNPSIPADIVGGLYNHVPGEQDLYSRPNDSPGSPTNPTMYLHWKPQTRQWFASDDPNIYGCNPYSYWAQETTTPASFNPAIIPGSTVPISFTYNSATRNVNFQCIGTRNPTMSPTIPTVVPTLNPTNTPTSLTNIPTDFPTLITSNPTHSPTNFPSIATEKPTFMPTQQPSISTQNPTINPSSSTQTPTNIPSLSSKSPTTTPTNIPTNLTSIPTNSPTNIPSIIPSINPSTQTDIPTNAPSFIPTINPSSMPTTIPTNLPSSQTLTPTIITKNPSISTNNPANTPTFTPTIEPTLPTTNPNIRTQAPTLEPSIEQTNIPIKTTSSPINMTTSFFNITNTTTINSSITDTNINNGLTNKRDKMILTISLSCTFLVCLILFILLYIGKRNGYISKTHEGSFRPNTAIDALPHNSEGKPNESKPPLELQLVNSIEGPEITHNIQSNNSPLDFSDDDINSDVYSDLQISIQEGHNEIIKHKETKKDNIMNDISINDEIVAVNEQHNEILFGEQTKGIKIQKNDLKMSIKLAYNEQNNYNQTKNPDLMQDNKL